MDILTIQNLQDLINLGQEPFVSIYMPTYSSGVDIRQNPVRFKKLLREAEANLYNLEMKKSEVEIFLKPAVDLIGKTPFWQKQSEGLALFIYPGGMEYYRLPFSFKESITVSNRIYIKPLLPLFTGNGQFNILALSKNEVRLFRCTRQNIIELELEDAPDNIYDMQVDDDARTKLLIRTSNPVGPNQLVYNKVTQGQANENDYEKNQLTRYFRAIDKSLLNMENDNHIPLVLAGVEYLIPIYREKSNYPYIVEDFIRGNPEILTPKELHGKAWEIVEPIFTKDQKIAEDKYHQYVGQNNKLYMNSLREIIPAAFNGQVEFLFLDHDIYKWGKFHHDINKIEYHDEEKIESEDLMEYVSLLTLSRGGKVFATNIQDISHKNPVAAVLRY